MVQLKDAHETVPEVIIKFIKHVGRCGAVVLPDIV
jgi:hypothetical protein